jgi:hypothetical protein
MFDSIWSQMERGTMVLTNRETPWLIPSQAPNETFNHRCWNAYLHSSDTELHKTALFLFILNNGQHFNVA